MDIRQELNDFIVTRRITQSAVARALGVSAAQVNQYLQDKYKGDVAALEAKIAAWLSREHDKLSSPKLAIEYIGTATAKRAQGLMKLAHQEGEAVVMYGQAGLGKTAALKAYKDANADAILIETDPGYTAKVLMQEIAARIGTEVRGSLHDISEGIISKLRGSGRLLMIDEAELLPLRALECLRRIHDKAGVGLVLCGMPRLLVNLKGKRGELVQLYSRVGFALNLGDELAETELDEIAQAAMPQMDDAARSEAVRAARGNTRRLCKLLTGIARMERVNGTAANVVMVRQFKEMLIH